MYPRGNQGKNDDNHPAVATTKRDWNCRQTTWQWRPGTGEKATKNRDKDPPRTTRALKQNGQDGSENN